MPRIESASDVKKSFVKDELPYLLLAELYRDCRQSARELGTKFGVSYHTIAKTLVKLDQKYGLVYTLKMDEQKLGFTVGKLITIKFKQKPVKEMLMKSLINSVYVQNAYLSNGDFDLLLYVVGLSPEAFCVWTITLEAQLSDYGVRARISDRDNYSFGFFPLRNNLLDLSPALSKPEKTVLKLLNENARMRLKDLVKKSKMTQMQVVYTIKKLRKEGVIVSFSALTQRPEKSIFIAYFYTMAWYRKNHVELYLNFWKELLKQDFREVTSDYCLEADVHGAYKKIDICTFKDGEHLSKYGPELRQRSYAPEGPLVRSASLTHALIGKWPFHLDHYDNIAINVKAYEKTPEIYPFGGTWNGYMKGINLQRILNERKQNKQ